MRNKDRSKALEKTRIEPSLMLLTIAGASTFKNNQMVMMTRKDRMKNLANRTLCSAETQEFVNNSVLSATQDVSEIRIPSDLEPVNINTQNKVTFSRNLSKSPPPFNQINSYNGSVDNHDSLYDNDSGGSDD